MTRRTDPSVPSVAVIVLTWNRPHELIDCLDSFACLDYPNYETVVVDNHSEDDTVQIVRERYPWATLIVNEDNLGYVGGNNVGIRYALDRGFDYVCILNSDTKVSPNLLSGLVEVMRSDPKIAIAGAKNLLMEHPDFTWGRYGTITFGPMLVRVDGRFEADHEELPCPKDVDCVVGNGCMMSRAALLDVGLFDEEFFQVNEDIDWCVRARKKGYRTVFVDRVSFLHKGSSSSDAGNKWIFSYGYFLGRNAILFARKHATPAQWVKLVFNMVVGVTLRGLLSAIVGLVMSVTEDARFVRGMIDGYRGKFDPDQAMTRGKTTWKPIGESWINSLAKWLGA